MLKKVFVCSAIIDQKIISQVIEALDNSEASLIYKEKYGNDPEQTLGPFLQKIEKKVKAIKFSIDNTKKMSKRIYNSCLVNAFYLKEPKNSAYLIFVKNLQDGSCIKNNKTTIVSIDELKEYNEK